MTKLSNGTIVTDLRETDINKNLTEQGYSIRHVETWLHDVTTGDDTETCIVWDAPDIAETDLPF